MRSPHMAKYAALEERAKPWWRRLVGWIKVFRNLFDGEEHRKDHPENVVAAAMTTWREAVAAA